MSGVGLVTWTLKSVIILDSKQDQGGASRHAGGREERPPHVSSQGAAATSAPKRWIPPSITRRDARHPEEQNDAIFRKVRGILNKLTPEKFDKLSLELLNVGIANQVILKGIILLIFEKALDEPKYSTLYAQLCHRLCQDAPNFEPPSSNISTFRRLLLNKCQDEFENRSKATEAFEGRNSLTPDEGEQLQLAKHKMLGNIKFIGELGKLEMLHEGILHKCIKQLLEKKRHVKVADMAEDLECLCQIMKTVGRRLDRDKARSWMDAYFDRIKKYQTNPELPSRIRFMLQDVVELRENNWKPRKIMQDNGPKTIGEVREEAAKDFGMIAPNQTRLSSLNMFGPMMMNGNIMGFPGPGGGRGGLNDMFGGPMGMLSGGEIGTGPGVIPMDGFTTGGGYSTNMGRPGRNMNMMMHPNQVFQKPYETRHRQQRQDSDEGSPKMEQRNNRPNNKQQQNQQQQRETRERDGGGGGGEQGRNSTGGGGAQYYNNRNNNQQQQNRDMGAGRELPPRFMKKFQQQQTPNDTHAPMYNGRGSGGRDAPEKAFGGGGPPLGAMQTNGPSLPPGVMAGGLGGGVTGGDAEISLRPARTFTSLKPNTPSMLPKSAQINVHSHTPPMTRPGQHIEELNPLKQKQAQITIKQAPVQDKSKQQKQKNHTKEELNEAREKMLMTYFEEVDAEAAAATVKELKAPKKYLNELVAYVMLESLDKNDADQDNVSKLILAFKKDGVITGEHYMEGLTSVLDKMASLSVDVPLVKSYVAKMAAQGVSNQLVSLLELSRPMDGGAHYPLFLLVLQQLHKIHDSDWVTAAFQESKINLQDMLPESDRSEERMMEILEDRGLSFMFPLLRVQADLCKQMRADPSPTNIFRWIRDSVKEELQRDARFINILITNIVSFVTSESTLVDGLDSGVLPDKSLQNKEKELLGQYQPMLQKLLQEKSELQLTTIYAMQVHCYNNSFPKGMLLRLFMYMYDLDVIDEGAYFRWKEEVNDEYPGKGKALFQVNQWLTWLEQAEEESEEDDE